MVQPAFPFRPLPGRRLCTTSLRLLFTCCLLQAPGCLHRPPEPATPASKPTTADKPGASQPTAGPQTVEQSEKDKPSDKRPSAQKEKKTAVSAEKKPTKRPELPDESISDTLAPPPPLKPPTFGGAGG